MAHRQSEGRIGADLCTEPECHQPVKARGLCNKHYLRQWTAGTLSPAGAFAHNRSSGVRGVTWDRARGKWCASVERGGRKFYLGRYDDLADAEAAAQAGRGRAYRHLSLSGRGALTASTKKSFHTGDLTGRGALGAQVRTPSGKVLHKRFGLVWWESTPNNGLQARWSYHASREVAAVAAGLLLADRFVIVDLYAALERHWRRDVDDEGQTDETAAELEEEFVL